MLEVTPVPAFQDNYIWLFRQTGADQVCVVDPGDAGPVLRYLEREGLGLEAILLTHHHADHIGGVNQLLQHSRVPVYGPASERIPQVSEPLTEGDSVTVAGIELKVLEVPGHTLDHIAYYSPESVSAAGPVLFCGDTLFAGGCGRMFEGTPPMMHESLGKLAALPSGTQVFCAHEYTLANLKFAAAAMPANEALHRRIDADRATREQGRPTVPSKLALELQTNPFLRCDNAEVISSVSARSERRPADPAGVFGLLREWKDVF